MATDNGRTFYAWLLVLALIGQGFFSVGCGPSGNGDGPPKGARKSVSQWVHDLKAAYRKDGMRGFEAARASMRARESVLRDDLDYDTAAMVLTLGETAVTRKESDLTAALRTLAEFIETHPGQARAEHDRLRGKLFSYSFGNGPVDNDSVPAKLVDLYSLIANGNGD